MITCSCHEPEAEPANSRTPTLEEAYLAGVARAAKSIGRTLGDESEWLAEFRAWQESRR